MKWTLRSQQPCMPCRHIRIHYIFCLSHTTAFKIGVGFALWLRPHLYSCALQWEMHLANTYCSILSFTLHFHNSVSFTHCSTSNFHFLSPFMNTSHFSLFSLLFPPFPLISLPLLYLPFFSPPCLPLPLSSFPGSLFCMEGNSYGEELYQRKDFPWEAVNSVHEIGRASCRERV